nr:hypothetical protein [Saprospiraceae bacterium]
MKLVKAGIAIVIILVLIFVSGWFLPAEDYGEGQVLIKDHTYRISETLNRDLQMVEWFSEASGYDLQTIEQKRTRERRDGVLIMEPNPTAAVDNEFTIVLYRPWKREINLKINFEESHEGTELMYTYTHVQPLFFRMWGKILNLDARLKSILDSFLERLKMDAESQFVALIDGYYIRQRDEIERIFITKRKKVPFSEMNHFTVSNLTSLVFYLQERQMKKFPLSTMYYFIDAENEETDMAIASEVDRDIELPPEFEMKYVAKGPLVYTNHYGYVGNTYLAHAAIQKYLDRNDLIYIRPFIETYVVGEETTDEVESWITRIEYYLDTTFD